MNLARTLGPATCLPRVGPLVGWDAVGRVRGKEPIKRTVFGREDGRHALAIPSETDHVHKTGAATDMTMTAELDRGTLRGSVPKSSGAGVADGSGCAGKSAECLQIVPGLVS